MVKATASSSKATSKPYERVGSAKGKGKALDPLSLGAPSQATTQTSRKGKKAWRKNVDISAEEEALERARDEERITGGKLSQRLNDQLFTVDTTGDVDVAKRMRRAAKPLKSLAILEQRSAVPSFTSKPMPSKEKIQKKLSREEKDRLRRIARRNIVGPDGEGMGSADIRKIAEAAADAWEEEKRPEVIGGYGEEGMVKRKVKAPKSVQARREQYLDLQVESGLALDLPEAGTSYNPSAESHASLLDKAVQEELELLAQEDRLAAAVKAFEAAGAGQAPIITGEEYAPGMQIGPGQADDSDEADETEPMTSKVSKRKTQAQRNKAARQKEQKRREAEELGRKNLLKTLAALPAEQARQKKLARQRSEELAQRRLAKKQRERLGLQGGEKVGKHRVRKGAVAVQLGEDLAESLRQLKPEGNLFKDRFTTLQKRGLIEPRVPVIPGKQAKTKQYEKHAFKRFV